jgi:3-isopropylmalate/(R)-2-methylmalate dehydratase small subunit
MTEKKIKGRVFILGDNIDTDLIIAARYLNSSDPHHLAKYVMEDADPEFASKVQPGDIIVAGENFGCGSSREHAPIALKAAGVSAIVAKSFARIFYRNAFNMGLAIFELDEVDEILEGDLIKINLDSGEISDVNKHNTYKFTPIPPFMQELLSCGGLINYAKEELLKNEA